jgi:hypothetical protein
MTWTPRDDWVNKEDIVYWYLVQPCPRRILSASDVANRDLQMKFLQLLSTSPDLRA